MQSIFPLLFPAFIAGLLTFLAPCTLPLVPAYLGFIGGVSAKDMQDPKRLVSTRRKVFFNGVFYVLGFSLVFIVLGTIFSGGGLALVKYEDFLQRLGGAFIIFFGLYLMGTLERIPFVRSIMSPEHRFKLPHNLKPGSPASSFIFGATFAFGWTPCVGPILGSVLLLASSSTTVLQGTLLLAVFSLGLAVPFLVIALGVGHATQTIKKLSKILPHISFVGGLFLLFLGILLLTDSLSIWFMWTYRFFELFQSNWLLKYL